MSKVISGVWIYNACVTYVWSCSQEENWKRGFLCASNGIVCTEAADAGTVALDIHGCE